MPKITLHNEVAETLLIPLYQRALETRRPDGMLHDENALKLVDQIDYDFTRIKLQGHDEVALILRVREFDRRAMDFINRHPQAVVVHIGCGLDMRFERIASQLPLMGDSVEWYDLDLPEVIELRRKLVDEPPHCHFLACSVLDPDWMDVVSVHAGRPFLFLSEGVLVYFTEAQVKGLALALKERFPGCELVTDGMTPFVMFMDNFQLAFSKMKARMRWSMKNPHDLESWGEGIRLLDEWYYFNTPEPRMKGSQWMGRIPLLAKSVGIFHYQLGVKLCTEEIL
jgi:O-methyltransferase involved in polyketide biosynthesis